MAANRSLLILPGDGIGPEVIGAAVRVMEAAGGRIAWDETVYDGYIASKRDRAAEADGNQAVV